MLFSPYPSSILMTPPTPTSAWVQQAPSSALNAPARLLGDSVTTKPSVGMMPSLFMQPTLVLGTSLDQWPPKHLVQLLQGMGIRAVVFDLDGTLVPQPYNNMGTMLRQAMDPVRSGFIPPASVAQLAALRQAGIAFTIVSNSPVTRYIQTMATALGMPIYGHAQKPSTRKLQQAMVEQFGGLQLRPQQIALIGNTRKTDVMAGNKLGLVTILVDTMPYCSLGRRDPNSRSTWRGGPQPSLG
jgi:predicted HAD superfamily phosphohydrolase YqeG